MRGRKSRALDSRGGRSVRTTVALALFLSLVFTAAAAATTISGTVLENGGGPVEGLEVRAYDAATGEVSASGLTAADGTYNLTGISGPVYQVRTWNPGGIWVDQWYAGLSALVYGRLAANVVDASAGDQAGIDFALDQFSISGTVVATGGIPLEGVTVIAYDGSSAEAGRVDTAADGSYRIPGLLRSQYAVRTGNALGYVDRWYGGPTVVSGWGGLTVDLNAGPRSDIDFTLGLSRTISGLVTDEVGNPLFGANVYARESPSGLWLGSDTTTLSGAYGVTVPAGVVEISASLSGYLGASMLVDATVGDVTSGADLVLIRSRSIRGAVADALGNPLGGVWVYLLDAQGSSFKSAYTNTAGAFILSDIGPGTYFVCTWGGDSYIGEYYQNVHTTVNDWTAATPIVVGSDDVGGIDFLLESPTVAGTITDAASGLPVPEGSRVELVYRWSSSAAASATTAADGSYLISGVSPNLYHVRTSGIAGYFDQWSGGGPVVLDQYGSGASEIDTRTGPVTGIDIAVGAGVSISGTVTADEGGPLEGILVEVQASTGGYAASAATDADGVYLVDGLPPGFYNVLVANGQGYVGEWYNDVRVGQGDPTPVDTSAGDVTGVHFALAPLRSISGAVTDSLGNPLPNVQVYLYERPWWGASGGTSTDALGNYEFTGLTPGSYRLRAVGGAEYLAEWYLGLLEVDGHYYEDATPVDVGSGDQTGIDFSLERAFTVEGHVVLADTGLPAGRGEVRAYSTSGTTYMWAPVQSDGAYRFTGLASGVYKLKFSGYPGYIDEWWDGFLTPLGYGFEDASALNLTAGSVTGIDFTLEPFRQISGRVRNPLGVPLGGVLVKLYTPLGAPTSYQGYTDTEGRYTIQWLPPGTYAVRTAGLASYLHEWYNDKPVGAWSALTADWVSTAVGSQTGIDFTLAWDDGAMPDTQLESGPRNGFATAEQLRLEGTATDDAWVRRVEYSTDGGTMWTAADITGRFDNGRAVKWVADLGASTLWPEGTPYRVLVRAVDGLLGADPDPLDIAFVTDYVPPVLTWDAPADGAEISGGVIVLSGTLADTVSGARSVWVRLRHPVYGQKVYDVAMAEDADIFDYVYPGASTWEARLNVPSGLVTLEVWGVDAAGNVTEVLGPRHIESSVPPPPPTPPVTTLLWGPEGGFANLADLRIQGAARDDDWIETVEYSLDDGATWAPTPGFARGAGGASAAWILDLPSIGVTPIDGDAYHVLVRSTDGEGVVGSPLELAFVLDLTPPPVPTWDSPLDGLLTTEPVVVFSGSAADDRSGVRRVVIEVEASGGIVSYLPPLAADPDPSDDVYPLDTPWQMDITLPGGVVRARAMSMDAAGNPSDPTPWRTLTIDVPTTTSTTVPSTTTTTAPTPTGVLSYPAAVGWNLLAGGPGSDIFGQTLYHYSAGSYASLGGAAMAAGRGYWVRLANAGTLSLVTVDTPLTVHLYPGWNQIGNSTQNQVSLPPGLAAFVFSGGSYASHMVLEPGQGAWVKVAAEQDVVLE